MERDVHEVLARLNAPVSALSPAVSHGNAYGYALDRFDAAGKRCADGEYDSAGKPLKR
jgi:hypothetical protein